MMHPQVTKLQSIISLWLILAKYLFFLFWPVQIYLYLYVYASFYFTICLVLLLKWNAVNKDALSTVDGDKLLEWFMIPYDTSPGIC